jgi:hypothetical protein
VSGTVHPGGGGVKEERANGLERECLTCGAFEHNVSGKSVGPQGASPFLFELNSEFGTHRTSYSGTVARTPRGGQGETTSCVSCVNILCLATCRPHRRKNA